MGLGPNILALYHQLKRLGAFDGITDVLELGSQGIWCPDRRMLVDLFEAFGKPVPPEDEIAPYISVSGEGQAPSRHLHQALGFNYTCVDFDKNFGSIPLDFNFDAVPPEHQGRYGLTTNHGTTEHVFNQYNAFKMIHDFTKAGGLMLHALPFTGYVEHGFFNYQPNLFEALAKYNSYRTLGVWLHLDWRLSSLVPWEPGILESLALNPKTTTLVVVLQQKMYATEFCLPIQRVYETTIPEQSSGRYQAVVDGEYYSGRRFSHLLREAVEPVPDPAPVPVPVPVNPALQDYPGREVAKEFVRRITRRIWLGRGG